MDRSGSVSGAHLSHSDVDGGPVRRRHTARGGPFAAPAGLRRAARTTQRTTLLTTLRTTLLTALLTGIALLALASCKACGPQCSGLEARDGCFCTNDVDCADSNVKRVLLCDADAHVCTPGDPGDVASAVCATDTDCAASERCANKTCQIAPSCQRVDVAGLQARSSAVDAVTEVAAELQDCTHAWQFAQGLTTFTIGLDGTITGAGACPRGRWVASRGAGVFHCDDGYSVAVSARVACFSDAHCAGGSCVVFDEDSGAGVCE